MGNVTFSDSNLTAGKRAVIRIVAGAASRTLVFPGWKFVGGAAPTSIAANKTALLSLNYFGTIDADGVAEYKVEP